MAQERKVPVLKSDDSLIEQEFESVREKFENAMHKMEDEMSRFRSQLMVSEKNRLLPSINSCSMSSTSTSSRLRSMGNADIDQYHQKQPSAHSPGSLSGQSLSEQRTSCSSSSSSHRSTRASSSVKSSIKSAFEEKEELVERHKQQLEATSSMNSNNNNTTNNRQHYGGAKSRASANNWLNELTSPLIKDSTDGTGRKILKLRFDVTQYEPEQIVVKTVDNRLLVHAKREQTSQNSSVYSEYNREFLLPDGIDPELIRSSLSADGVLTVEAPLPAENGAFSAGLQLQESRTNPQ